MDQEQTLRASLADAIDALEEIAGETIDWDAKRKAETTAQRLRSRLRETL